MQLKDAKSELLGDTINCDTNIYETAGQYFREKPERLVLTVFKGQDSERYRIFGAELHRLVGSFYALNSTESSSLWEN